MSEDPKDKIVQLFKEGTKPKRRRPQSRAGNAVSVNGNGNVVAGGDVHYHLPSPPAARPKVRPGIEHITAEQRAILRKLVEEVAETEARLKRSPRGFSSVYSALFNQFDEVKKLEQIPLDGFEQARSYLYQRRGQLNGMRSAPIKNADQWRKTRYAYIKVNSKAPEDAEALDRYIRKNFNAGSLTELANDELERAYRYIAGRRNKR
ncbi:MULTISPECIES: hypothetical protein [Paracoccus]|uniref:Uncharacterized protein n=1 Tax=Paracoccus versutus TaxID=34007 RepID=A0A3D9XGZ5_PARVE|nr:MULTISPECIES: hypothetical protein [Paracoccus]REF69740.1 hypothetical protein BDD41_2454 [Paracoccus versutus]WGR57897.1 hypothetical protein E3U25_18290 [Paracoccus versutus]